MRRISLITTTATTIVLGAAFAASDAEAKLDLYVDKSSQRISVVRDGALLYVWPVSTGRDSFSTPNGVYAPERLERSWFSKAYYNAPMPYAIFFHNGYAIHGSYDIARLGGPASHGCVRLHPQNAALLYGMVEREGPANTSIVIEGDTNFSRARPRNFDDALRPRYRNDGAIARGPYPPGSYPPGPMTPPRDNGDRYSDGEEAYPPGARTQPYRSADRYADRYGDGRGAYPSTPQMPPYRADPYAGGEDAYPPGPGLPSPYRADRYRDGRSAPPRGPRISPYDSADRYVDGPPGRRRSDGGQITTRGTANRPPVARLDGEMPVEPTLSRRGGVRPATTTAKSNSPGRLADEPSNHRVGGAGEPARSPPPAYAPSPAPATSVSLPSAPVAKPDAPADQSQSNTSYKVLPQSYWAGAAWRWRLKRDEGAVSGPPSGQ